MASEPTVGYCGASGGPTRAAGLGTADGLGPDRPAAGFGFGFFSSA